MKKRSRPAAACRTKIFMITLVSAVALAALANGPAGRSDDAQKREPGKVGTKAPAFSATLLDGGTLDSADLRGKVVVLKFWYIACAPCRQEIPALNKLVEEFAGRPVVFLGLALDARPKLLMFLEEVPFRYKIAPDAGPIAESYAISLYPTHVIIDRKGTIVYFGAGGGLQTPEMLRPIITAALNQ